MKRQFTDKITLKKGADFGDRQCAVEFARALGFSCEAAVFPVTTWEEGLRVPDRISDLCDLQPVPQKEANEIPEDYVASSDSPLPMLHIH